MYPHDVIVVLVTHGKHEYVNYAQVVVFAREDQDKVKLFLQNNNTGKVKHWTKAEVMTRGDDVESEQPQD